MDLPQKPKTPPAKRPKKTRSAAEERQAEALAKIAKNYRRVRVSERRKGPQFVAVLLSFLGAALVLYKIFGTGLWKEEAATIEDVAPETAVAGARTGPIDATLFREPIEAFEKPLFGAAAAPDLETLTATVLRQGNKLTGALQLDPGFAASRRAAHSLQQALDELATRQPGRLEDLGRLRQAWLEVRQLEFSPAPFFLSAGDMPARDQLALTAYRSLVTALDQALTAAFDRASAYAREPADGETPEERQRRLAGLDQVASELVQQIAGLRRSQPERPSGNLDPNLMVAIQSLEQALAQAESLAGSSANLTPAGQSAFDGVAQLIDRTRNALDHLGR